MSEDGVDLIRRGVAALAAVDLDTLGESALTELVDALQELRGGFDAGEARVLARWDTTGAWRADGARNAAAWLRWRHRLPIQVARQRLSHARAARDLPVVAEAWAAGEIDRAHVTGLLGVRTARTEAALDRDQEVLVHAARSRGYIDFKRIVDLWARQVDPDGAEDKAAQDQASRDVYLAQSFGGMFLGKITLDPVSGTIVHGTLTAIERELFDADWAQAKERLGRDPMIFELSRTPAQRRADAFVEMAIRARTAPANGRRPAPLFTVLVGWETLHGPIVELNNRLALTPGSLIPWLDQAEIERVVFDATSRPIDVSVTRRLFTNAQRRGVLARDRRCFDPTCDELPDRPQIDHITPYSQGGETTIDNARLACGFHNRARNTREGPAPPDDP